MTTSKRVLLASSWQLEPRRREAASILAYIVAYFVFYPLCPAFCLLLTVGSLENGELNSHPHPGQQHVGRAVPANLRPWHVEKTCQGEALKHTKPPQHALDLLIECVEESHAYGTTQIESRGPVVAP